MTIPPWRDSILGKTDRRDLLVAVAFVAELASVALRVFDVWPVAQPLGTLGLVAIIVIAYRAGWFRKGGFAPETALRIGILVQLIGGVLLLGVGLSRLVVGEAKLGWIMVGIGGVLVAASTSWRLVRSPPRAVDESTAQ